MKNHTRHISHRQIADLLTHSTEQIDESVLASLSQARCAALQKQRAHAPAFSLSTAGHHLHMPHTTGQWLAAAILLATLMVGVTSYWHHSQELQINHLDIQILTDDMPMEVFIDQ